MTMSILEQLIAEYLGGPRTVHPNPDAFFAGYEGRVNLYKGVDFQEYQEGVALSEADEKELSS